MHDLAHFLMSLVPLTLIIAVVGLIAWTALVYYTTWLVCRVVCSHHRRAGA